MSYTALQQAIKAVGGNKTELARRMEVERQLIYVWLKNKRVPRWRVDKLKAIGAKIVP